MDAKLSRCEANHCCKKKAMSYTYCGARLRECVEECEANSDMDAKLFRCEAREEREAI